MQATPARLLAALVILACAQAPAHANDTLESLLRRGGLKKTDSRSNNEFC